MRKIVVIKSDRNGAYDVQLHDVSELNSIVSTLCYNKLYYYEDLDRYANPEIGRIYIKGFPYIKKALLDNKILTVSNSESFIKSITIKEV
jgi:hypothetical protein